MIVALATRGAPRGREPARYQAQDSPQTLAEALDEYYARNLGRVSLPADLPPQSAALFRNHDMCHVIFGLDTTLADEALADARTLLSCDVGARRYAAYLAQDQTARSAFKSAGYGRVAWTTIAAIPRIFRAVLEAFRMPRRWPWTPPAEFAGRSLADLRRTFRIRVM